MLAEKVDAKLLPCLGEPKHAIEGNNVSEDPPAFVIVNHFQELAGHLFGGTVLDSAKFGFGVEVVDPLVLVVKQFVQHGSPNALVLEHASYEPLEVDITVVQFVWYWTGELKFVGLETAWSASY